MRTCRYVITYRRGLIKTNWEKDSADKKGEKYVSERCCL